MLTAEHLDSFKVGLCPAGIFTRCWGRRDMGVALPVKVGKPRDIPKIQTVTWPPSLAVSIRIGDPEREMQELESFLNQLCPFPRVNGRG